MFLRPLRPPRTPSFTRPANGLFALVLTCAPCAAQDAPAPPPATEAVPETAPRRFDPPQPADLAEAKRLVVETFPQLAQANLADALTQAITLRKDLRSFASTPAVPSHLNAKLAWLNARMPFQQSTALGIAGDPTAALNAWPLEPAFLDYAEGKPGSGIVGDPDTYPELSPEVIAALNGAGGEGRVATGYHAIEFLLWGEDASPESAGTRTHVDYDATLTPHAGRRGLYLIACGDLLVRQLTRLHGDWVPGRADNARAEFAALPEAEALASILGHLAALAGDELAGQLRNALATESQRAEESQFSDTTHIDLLHRTAGIANLVAGAYVDIGGEVKVLGVGLAALADAISPEHGQRLRDATNAALQAAATVEAPFDGEIRDDNPAGRARVLALAEALTALAGEIEALADAL